MPRGDGESDWRLQGETGTRPYLIVVTRGSLYLDGTIHSHRSGVGSEYRVLQSGRMSNVRSVAG